MASRTQRRRQRRERERQVSQVAAAINGAPPLSVVVRAAPPVIPENPNDVSYGDLGGQIATGGRQTIDHMGFYGKTPVIMPPPNDTAQWDVLALDENAFNRASPEYLLNLLAACSPDISRALWDFLRLFNPGYAVSCFRPGTDAPHRDAQKLIDSFLATLRRLYGTVDVIHAKLAISMFMRGAMFSELILDASGRMAIDLATPDPSSVRFRLREDPQRGQVYELGQVGRMADRATDLNGGFKSLEKFATVVYIPLDPAPGSPYGRPMVAPALFASIFLLGLLHDIKRVISQQGYPRLDIAIDLEQLLKEAPTNVRNQPAAWESWVQKTIGDVVKVYRQLQPDDAYVHSNSIEVRRPVGTADATSLGAIPGIIQILERWITRALKTMSVTQGTSSGTTETQANREWEIQAAGIKAIQHFAETLLERQLGLVLRAAGIQADVEVRYAELRAAEMLRDAQTEGLRIANSLNKWAYGYQTLDASAMEITGHAAVEEEPLYLPRTDIPTGSAKGSAPAGQDVNAQPEAGEGSDVGNGKAESDKPPGTGNDSGRILVYPTGRFIMNENRKPAAGQPRYTVRPWRRGLRPAPGQRGGPVIPELWYAGEREAEQSPITGTPLPDATPTVDRRSIRRARQLWDAIMPERAGLLDAEVKASGQ